MHDSKWHSSPILASLYPPVKGVVPSSLTLVYLPRPGPSPSRGGIRQRHPDGGNHRPGEAGENRVRRSGEEEGAGQGELASQISRSSERARSTSELQAVTWLVGWVGGWVGPDFPFAISFNAEPNSAPARPCEPLTRHTRCGS